MSRPLFPAVSSTRVSPESQRQFCAEHEASVRRWVWRLAGPNADLDDLVQDVFVTALARLPSFSGGSTITTWLFGIAINVVRWRRRRDRWRQRLWGLGDDVDRVEATGPTPSEEFERRERADLLYRALDDLPERHREVIVLFELEGLRGDEIAKLMRCSVANVWVRLHRARLQLSAAVARRTVREP